MDNFTIPFGAAEKVKVIATRIQTSGTGGHVLLWFDSCQVLQVGEVSCLNSNTSNTYYYTELIYYPRTFSFNA